MALHVGTRHLNTVKKIVRFRRFTCLLFPFDRIIHHPFESNQTSIQLETIRINCGVYMKAILSE